MDHRIYGHLPRTDLGVYGTRRYPKGAIIPGSPGIDMSKPENRNPTPFYLRFAQATVPAHSNVTRWEYTVPTARQALLLAAEAEFNRQLVGAGNAQVFIGVFLTRKDAPLGSICEIVRVTNRNDNINGVNAERANYPGTPIMLFEGDRVFALSGGSNTVDYLVVAHFLEYDASIRGAAGGAYAGDFSLNPATGLSTGVLQQPTYGTAPAPTRTYRGDTAGSEQLRLGLPYDPFNYLRA